VRGARCAVPQVAHPSPSPSPSPRRPQASRTRTPGGSGDLFSPVAVTATAALALAADCMHGALLPSPLAAGLGLVSLSHQHRGFCFGGPVCVCVDSGRAAVRRPHPRSG
jgi:hypothetical protein